MDYVGGDELGGVAFDSANDGEEVGYRSVRVVGSDGLEEEHGGDGPIAVYFRRFVACDLGGNDNDGTSPEFYDALGGEHGGGFKVASGNSGGRADFWRKCVVVALVDGHDDGDTGNAVPRGICIA